MKVLYEVLVPTIYGDTNRPISTKHHKNWDKYIHLISGGMTLMMPAKGRCLEWFVRFVNQFGDYLTREQAWVIAEKNGQIIRDVSCAGTLYSENLF